MKCTSHSNVVDTVSKHIDTSISLYPLCHPTSHEVIKSGNPFFKWNWSSLTCYYIDLFLSWQIDLGAIWPDSFVSFEILGW